MCLSQGPYILNECPSMQLWTAVSHPVATQLNTTVLFQTSPTAHSANFLLSSLTRTKGSFAYGYLLHICSRHQRYMQHIHKCHTLS